MREEVALNEVTLPVMKMPASLLVSPLSAMWLFRIWQLSWTRTPKSRA